MKPTAQIGGMNRTSAPPGPNMIDGGSASKPMVNNQQQQNALHTQQEMVQNAPTAGQPANVTTQRTIENQSNTVSDQEIAAQQYARERIAETLYANDAGSAMMKLNSITQSPEKAKFMNDLAVSKAMAVGSSPELGSAAASVQQYV